MNNLAILPYLSLHALQIQNVKRNVVKKAVNQFLSKKEEESNPVDNDHENNTEKEVDQDDTTKPQDSDNITSISKLPI